MTAYNLTQVSYEDYMRLSRTHLNLEGYPRWFAINLNGELVWWPKLGANDVVHSLLIQVETDDVKR